MNWRLLSLAVAGMLLLSACGTDSAGESDDLTVAAASSLQAAFMEIGEAYEAETGQPVTFSFGSTGNLVAQIENGAPFDVFAAADETSIDLLIERGFVDPETRALYALGRIVLARNIASGVEVRELQDLLDPAISHVAIANPEHAPYGMAAQEALMHAGIWDAIQPKLVYGENIRQTLQFVQTGNAEAGIIALSIADVPEISYTLIDAGLHEPLLQAMAVVDSTSQPDAAAEFIAFVTGPKGGEILQRYGFTLPEQP